MLKIDYSKYFQYNLTCKAVDLCHLISERHIHANDGGIELNFKKMIFMTLFLAVLLSLNAICAAEMEEHDFDGNFQMEVPAGYTFTDENSFFGIDINPTKAYHDSKNNINISVSGYINDEECFSDMLKTLKAEPNVNLTQKEDNYLIKTEKFNIVLFKKEHKIVSISSDRLDFNTLTVMADSFKTNSLEKTPFS